MTGSSAPSLASPSADAKPCCQPARADILAFTTLLLLSLAIRLPFLAHGVMNGGSENYTFCALNGDFVTTPPGYFAFVSSGWLLNHLIHNINTSFVLISLFAGLASIAFCYILARSIGLRWPLALVAAGAYSASINLLSFGGLALSHTTEAMFATLFALLAHRAVTTRRFNFTLLATIVWAVSGAFRPSCTILLIPLWLYMIWKTHRSFALTLIQFAIGAIITLAWLKTDAALLAKATWAQDIPGNKSVAMQVYMPSQYDSSDASLGTRTGAAKPTYHMPGFEILAWVEDLIHIHVLPRPENITSPSLSHAGKLTAVQSSKLGFFLLLSAPILLALPFVLLLRRRTIVWPTRPNLTLLLFWILPPTLFYMFAHLGALGYLEIYLSGLFILTTYIVYAGPAAVQNATPTAPLWARGGRALLLFPAAGLAFFLFSSPLPADTSRHKLLNVLLFQYNGSAIHQLFSTSRNTADNTGGFEVVPDIRNARTDEELMAAYRKLNFCPVPRFSATQPATPAQP